jgi:hypothetical protein
MKEYIKIDIKELWWEAADWIKLGQYTVQSRALVTPIMTLQLPLKTDNFPIS